MPLPTVMDATTEVASPSVISMSNNFAHFRRTYKAAREGYRNEGTNPMFNWFSTQPCLGPEVGPVGAEGWRFGVEIEFENNPASVALSLYDEGYTQDSRVRGYHSSQDYHSWRCESDGSLHNGAEVISPILTDTVSSWESLVKVTNMLLVHDVVTHRSNIGGHISVDGIAMGENSEAWSRFKRIAQVYEDVFYRLATNPDRYKDEPSRRLRRHRISGNGFNSYAVPVTSGDFNRSNWINLESVNRYGVGRIEFRIFDGSHSASVIQARIKIATAMIRAALNPDNDAILDAQPVREMGWHRKADWWKNEDGSRKTRLLREDWKKDSEAVRSLADMLFDTTSDREMLISLFAMSDWSWCRSTNNSTSF